MLRFALVLLAALSVEAFAIPSGISFSCQAKLAPSGLGIGAIIRSPNRKLYLGLAPYAGASHVNLIRLMHSKHTIESILWMGEVRYKIENGIPQLIEANETSGYFYELSQQLDPKLGKDSIRVTNSLFNIPRSLRAEPFKAHPFDPKNFRLVPELNGLKSVRHDISAALQTIMTFTALMQMPKYTDEQRAKIYDDLISKFGNDIALVQWFIGNLVESDRVTTDQTRHVSQLLKYLKVGEWQKVRREGDQGTLEKELRVLSEQANILPERMPYEIFEVR